MAKCRTLKDVAHIWQCSTRKPPDKDTILIQRVSGSKANLGRVYFEPPLFDNRSFTKEPNLSTFICMKPKDPEQHRIFLASTMNHLRRQGYWLQMGMGTVQQFIRLSQVKNAPCREAEPVWFDEDQIAEYILPRKGRESYFNPRSRRR